MLNKFQTMTGENLIIEVVAAVVVKEGRYLICLRPDGKQHGGFWEFPGGKVDPGEDFASAIRRELLEELELEVTFIGETLFTAQERDSPFRINFIGVETRGNPVLHEHAAIRFCSLEEMNELSLAPSDQEFVIHLEDYQ
ncbi:NUDIX domain-containing protein [Microbulbifer guangxiensis]|uniref:NUDIX domain-containing protein n=1 Tax=Microbulbifer guangxiensis TaxID=2904249 RepID=UPI001F1A3C3F|nr:NUDIX domain-containing protein [Microbulbifer guangxiensis]